jgi:polyvinyl alcohol dehydrogenase (cytochrome)
MFGQNVCNTASQSNAGGISIDSVGRLKQKWVYNTDGEVSATPSVAGNAVYFADWGGMVTRLDANTGMAVWSLKVADLVGSSLTTFVSRTAPVVTDDAVIIGTQRNLPDLAKTKSPSTYVIALDPSTGAVKWKTLVDTHPAAGITSSPVVDGNRVYVGVASQEEVFAPYNMNYVPTFRGSVVALDVATGDILWKTYTITDDVYYGPGGAPPDAGARDGALDASDAGDAAPPPVARFTGASVWSSSPAVDRKRKQLYVSTGNNYDMPEGGTGAVEGDWVDSVLALDLDTGKINWGHSVPPNGSDVFALGVGLGPDFDFGCGPNLFTTAIDGKPRDLVGAGQKSGAYWAFDADTGATVWTTVVGPGGSLGGLHWGTATDGLRVYVEVNNGHAQQFTMLGNGSQAGQMTTTGMWAALDSATGNVVWEIADPAMDMPLAGASADGPTVVVNGVVFAGSMDSMGTMFALNAATGDVLWQFQSGGTVYGGPAVANGVVYWGCGYPATRLGFGTTCKKVYAFDIGP